MTDAEAKVTFAVKVGDAKIEIGEKARIPVTGTDTLGNSEKPFMRENVEADYENNVKNGDGTVTIPVKPTEAKWPTKPAQFFFKGVLAPVVPVVE